MWRSAAGDSDMWFLTVREHESLWMSSCYRNWPIHTKVTRGPPPYRLIGRNLVLQITEWGRAWSRPLRRARSGHKARQWSCDPVSANQKPCALLWNILPCAVYRATSYQTGPIGSLAHQRKLTWVRLSPWLLVNNAGALFKPSCWLLGPKPLIFLLTF